MSELAYLRWYFDETHLYAKMLTNEHMGELYFAVMDYAETGNKRAVSNEIIFPYEQLIIRCDNTKIAYARRCEVNRQNGSKGGRAKALNASKKRYVPPTKLEFKAMAAHLRKGGEIDADDYEILALFQELEEAGWTIGGEPIRNTKDLECAVIAKFDPDPSFNHYVNWVTFKRIFAAHCVNPLSLFWDFWDLFSKDTNSWTIKGTSYEVKNCKEAVDAFLDSIDENGECYRSLAIANER